MGLDDARKSAYQRRPLKRGSSGPRSGLESGLARRVEDLTAAFVDAIFVAIRSFPLEEIHPELRRRSALAPPESARTSLPPPSRRMTERASLPPPSRRTSDGAPRSRRFAERPGDEDAPASENVITNPEALLRAAFGDPVAEGAPSVPAILTSPSSQPPPSMRGSALRPGDAAPATSSASRVIRRRRS